MKQYNIYAGLGGSFGGANYQYTSLYETEDDANSEAYDRACEEYEQYEGLHGLYDWEDVLNEYCEERNISRKELTDEDSQEINEIYLEQRESWLDYYAVPTEEDNIDQEELILDYVIEDDCSSSANSE